MWGTLYSAAIAHHALHWLQQELLVAAQHGVVWTHAEEDEEEDEQCTLDGGGGAGVSLFFRPSNSSFMRATTHFNLAIIAIIAVAVAVMNGLTNTEKSNLCSNNFGSKRTSSNFKSPHSDSGSGGGPPLT